jgi:hypothetical protein
MEGENGKRGGRQHNHRRHTHSSSFSLCVPSTLTAVEECLPPSVKHLPSHPHPLILPFHLPLFSIQIQLASSLISGKNKY